MPFRIGTTYLTAEDLELERRYVMALSARSGCRNPFKRAWWWLTNPDHRLRPQPEPPSTWRAYR